MNLSKADRAWITKALRREVHKSEERMMAHLTDVLTEEARMAVLLSMKAGEPTPPPA